MANDSRFFYNEKDDSVFVGSDCGYPHGLLLSRDINDKGDDYWGGAVYFSLMLCPDRENLWNRIKIALRFIFNPVKFETRSFWVNRKDSIKLGDFLKRGYKKN